MDTGSRFARRVSPPVRWSLSVGAYALVCAALLVLALRQVTGLVADVLVLPTDSVLWLAVPAPFVGAVAWWAVVERAERYTYPRGCAAGLATALLTVLVWVLRGAAVWSPEGVAVGWPLVVAVLAPTVPAGVLAGVPVTYVRRQLGSAGASDGA